MELMTTKLSASLLRILIELLTTLSKNFGKKFKTISLL